LTKWDADGQILRPDSSGLTPTGDTLGGPMAEVARNAAEPPPACREAIADYLQSVRSGGWRP
jgi:hypothetical protein